MSKKFWEMIATQLDALESAQSADDVLRILRVVPGVSAGDGFFEGSGGDRTVWDSLRKAGWVQIWAKAAYYYAMRAPDGSAITYIEGDIYRGDRRG
ncbi:MULTISPECIES: hypothetical protein [unclassified Streptomyces]|uniref:hypothetical protein n=1 Tax=unclassified Streptomyces TaxID=2593676 RepID=UPI00081D6E59|nr:MULTISPECIES: hypothetical protein [unclassified Streptomyces]MYR95485.1 hypothetical protein [Streptomyces sp. SID4937]SCD91292.1 hypothetical protein GA0115243_104774 [Streptomyces sp. ScaeMP-e83]